MAEALRADGGWWMADLGGIKLQEAGKRKCWPSGICFVSHGARKRKGRGWGKLVRGKAVGDSGGPVGRHVAGRKRSPATAVRKGRGAKFVLSFATGFGAGGRTRFFGGSGRRWLRRGSLGGGGGIGGRGCAGCRGGVFRFGLLCRRSFSRG